jgi:hypothetical protein
VLKKIRRMLALQGLMWSAAMWFGWKNRDAIERSVRAAKAAWNEVGGETTSDVVVAAVVVPEVPLGEGDEMVDLAARREVTQPTF